tara:strand:- start:45 stop:647 length:603 start_codon:yes stop_codon:yes gene_type:complete
MLITTKQDNMKKSIATQKNSSIFGSGVNVGLAGKKVHEKRMQKLFKDPPSDKNLGLSAAGVAGTKTGAMAKQLAPIDPRTGMPMQPQMMPQPNTVGMPGSMPMPDGMGHNLPEHGIQAAGNKTMSPYMQRKKAVIPGGAISESGHVIENMKKGPRQGDRIDGIEYGPEGLPKDFDYKIKFKKDTVDHHGPFSIYEVYRKK